MENIEKVLGATSEILNTVPEVYADLAKPTAQQTGALLSRIPRAINAALAPIDIWIAKKEYSVEETKKLLEQKLQHIDPDKVVPPEPYVAVPAMQAISYSMDSETLRDMYANLLAKSMNADTKSEVHPAFVEMIKQLSPLDARILKILCEAQIRPLLTIRKATGDGEFTLFRYIINIFIAPIDKIAASIDNLLRCGLIEIPYYRSYRDGQLYDSIRKSQEYREVIEFVEKNILAVGEKIKEEKKMIEITDIGRSFNEICINE